LEAWKQFEENYGSDVTKKEILAKMPKKELKRRKIFTEDGV